MSGKKRMGNSRAARWSRACAELSEYIVKARDALEGFEEAVSVLQELKDEYEEWQGNLPENLASSPLGEKLEAVVELDIDFDELTSALDDAEEKVSEAEGIDLPLGFGRD